MNSDPRRGAALRHAHVRAVLLAAVLLLAGMVTACGTSAAAEPDLSDAALARSLPGGFEEGFADVNGVRLHYVAGGEGPALVLLPGYPQTWWAFSDVMPALARDHRVIAVDLRGMGASGKPGTGYDLRTMATDVRDLVLAMGYEEADVVGHDIGAMVAHVHGLAFPESTRRLVLMNVLAPDASLFQLPLLPPPGGGFHPWWWAFNQAPGVPEQLVAGRSRVLVDALVDGLALDPARIDERDRTVYADAYDTPEALRASSGWYRAMSQDIATGAGAGVLPMPVLGLASGLNVGYFQQALPPRAADARIVEIPDSGHYLPEEQPELVVEALRAFLR